MKEKVKAIPLLNAEGNILEFYLNDNCEIIMRSHLFHKEFNQLVFKPNKFALVRYLKNTQALSHLIDKSEILGLLSNDKLTSVTEDFSMECINCYNESIGFTKGIQCEKEINKLKSFLEFIFKKENWF